MQLRLDPFQGLPATTLTLHPGCTYGVIGRSGSGKTRLLRALALAKEWSTRNVVFVSQEAGNEWSEEDLQCTAYDLAMVADALGDLYIKVLRGVGFTKETQDVPLAKLSGGWRQRVAVALALLRNPDVFLGDEITNGLDLAGLHFVEQQLKAMPHTTCVITSHDRTFLANVCTDILYFPSAGAATASALVVKHFAGGFNAYEQRMAELQVDLERRVTAADKQRKQAASFVQDVKSKSRDADPNKQRQAKEKLDKMDKIGNFRSDGRRYKTQSLKKLDEKAVRLPEKTPLALSKHRDLRFNFVSLANPVEDARRHQSQVALDGVWASYAAGPTEPVLRNLTLALSFVSRIALVGLNGQGKSSLISLIAQQPWAPGNFRGELKCDPKLRSALVTQNAVDVMAATHGELSTVDFMLKHVLDEHNASEMHARQALGG